MVELHEIVDIDDDIDDDYVEHNDELVVELDEVIELKLDDEVDEIPDDFDIDEIRELEVVILDEVEVEVGIDDEVDIHYEVVVCLIDDEVVDIYDEYLDELLIVETNPFQLPPDELKLDIVVVVV